MNLENFSLLYPDEQTRQAHYSGHSVPDISMFVLDELGLTQIFDLKNGDLSDFFTIDPSLILARAIIKAAGAEIR